MTTKHKRVLLEMNFWEEKYQQNETGWERGTINPAFHHWDKFKHMQPGFVLVPGCGRSPEVLAFAELGWHVTAVDMATSAIEYQARACEKFSDRVNLIETDLLNWKPEQPFDLIYEQTCLCALPPELWQRYERCLFQWLKPSGIIAALFMQTGKDGGPPYHCDLGAMADLFHNTHWQWQEDEPIVSEHPRGIHELGLFLTKNK